MEKAPAGRGWSLALAEEGRQQGYPHELADFVDAVRAGRPPRQTGEDGRAALEMLLGDHAAAGRRSLVTLPLNPARATETPVALWRAPR